MIIILDNGHGSDTPGKRSPVWADGTQLMEWEFTRDIVKRIAAELAKRKVPYVILVPENEDISLAGRRLRANNTVGKYGKEALLISIHANAGQGTGWECWTSVGNTKADDYARFFIDAAKEYLPQFRIRLNTKSEPDKERDFYILKHTSCPAILTENLFMDTEEDCRFIMSETGRQTIADLHVAAILKIIDVYE